MTTTPVTPASGPGAGSAAAAAASATPAGRIAQAAVMGAGALFFAADARNLYVSRYNRSTGMYKEQKQFPKDLLSVSNHYISFLFQAYQKRSIDNPPFLRSEGKIRLPMPDNLKDNTEVAYDTKSLSPVVGATLDILSQGSISNITAEGVGRAVTNLGTSTGTAMALNPGGPAAELANAVKAFTGVTQNPYQTVLFQNPEFKTHSFTWKFVPKNKEESDEIRDIIRTFQFHMLPGILAGAGVLFSFPSMVTVSLFPSSDYLYRFKPCVINKVDVDYAPGGESSPSFYFDTNAPTAVSLKISLQEIEYWTNHDFESNKFDDNAAINAQNAFTSQQNINTTLVERGIYDAFNAITTVRPPTPPGPGPGQ
jgi:hypothetical protein